jgi:hypothetical protein
MSMRLIDAPPGYEALLAPLPDGATVDTNASAQHDFVQLFAANQAALSAGISGALASLNVGGLFWIAFPKGSSKLQTHLPRDKGWQPLHALGWQLVSLISIDDTWSAARIRPIAPK